MTTPILLYAVGALAAVGIGFFLFHLAISPRFRSTRKILIALLLLLVLLEAGVHIDIRFWNTGLYCVLSIETLALFWAASLVAYQTTKAQGWSWLAWCRSTPLALFLFVVPICLLVVLIMGARFVDGHLSNSTPRLKYIEAFHEEPSPDVRDIQSLDESVFWDHDTIFLKFHASHETFERLRANSHDFDGPRYSNGGYGHDERGHFRDISYPSWWIDYPDDSRTSIHAPVENDIREIRMSYDPDTQSVQYFLYCEE